MAALVVLLVDAGSKRLVARRLGEGQERRLAGALRIRRGTRRRLAVGDRAGPWLPLLAWIAIALLIALEAHYTARWRHPLAEIGLGAALGGALGNVWDRLSSRGIVDFVAIGRWPPFNVADAAITLGVALALWFAWT
jgi:signal peptidase II